MDHRRRQSLQAAGGALLLGVPLVAGAQPQGPAADWPARPVHLIVPNVPGGALDILARLLESELSKTWRQPIVVEFRPGAGTLSGTDYVAKSAPDGYTLGILAIGVLGIGSALFRDGVLIPNTEFGHLKFGPNIAEKYCGDRARKEQKLKWEGWATRFNEYLAHLTLLFSPDVFILGGGIANKTEKYLHLLKSDTEIVIATLKNNAGIVGAAYAAHDLMSGE